MSKKQRSDSFIKIVGAKKANAIAHIQGAPDFPQLRGTVKFYRLKEGVMVVAKIKGLPVELGGCPTRVHGCHIHAGDCCCGTPAEPFAAADGHYNPDSCPHPAHAGDLPPLFATETGQAWSAFLSDRFKLREILGRTVVIHGGVDDFTSQPSGNSGPMIGCGLIKPLK